MKAGQNFCEWTVLEKSKDKPSGYWLCECSCGVKRDVWMSSLKSGASKSCGHVQREREAQAVDKRMISKRFGRLVPIERVNKEGMAEYLCQCDCGNQTIVKVKNLVDGKTKSCGCLRVENSAKSIKNTYEAVEQERERATQYGSNIHSMNQKQSKISTTGHKGVSQLKSGKYRAYLYFEGKQYHGGTYNNLEDAVEARKKLEEKYFDPIRKRFESDEK